MRKPFVIFAGELDAEDRFDSQFSVEDSTGAEPTPLMQRVTKLEDEGEFVLVLDLRNETSLVYATVWPDAVKESIQASAS